MCLWKKKKPRPSGNPPEKPGPLEEPCPPQVKQPRASDQWPAPRRLSRHNHPVAQEQNYMGTPPSPPVNGTGHGLQPPRERHPRRARSLDQVKQPQASDQQRTDRRQSRLNNPPGSGGEIIIAVMGVTDAGKSYFIREVTSNPEVKVSSNLYSSTSKVQPYSFEYLGAKITLVDTPGFNDTNRSDAEVLQEIANWTSATYKKNQLLSGIIYLHPITHTRMEGSAMRNLKMFKRLCGQEVLENVLLTTTQWSRVDRTEGEFREDNLRDEGLWGGLIGKGATLQRFNGTRESGLELINKLVSKTRKPLHIQDQIVKQRMTLLETDAGRLLSKELAAQEKRFSEELESLGKQLREAMKAKDNEMNQILAAEQARAQKKLKRAEAEQRWLEGLHAAEVEQRKAKARRGRGGIEEHNGAVIAPDTAAGLSRPRLTNNSRTRCERPITMIF